MSKLLLYKVYICIFWDISNKIYENFNFIRFFLKIWKYFNCFWGNKIKMMLFFFCCDYFSVIIFVRMRLILVWIIDIVDKVCVVINMNIIIYELVMF